MKPPLFPKGKRKVTAPTSFSSGARSANRVLEVELAEGEAVERVWTTEPDGQSYVSGYRIIPRLPDAEP